MVKVWRQDTRERFFTDAGLENLDALMSRGINVLASEPFGDRFPSLTVVVRSRYRPADFFDVGGMFVVSEPLKKVIEEFHVKAEYFDLLVKYKGKPYTERNFFFVHILDYVDCFDYEKSKYDRATKPGKTDWVERVEELVIDEEKAAGHHLFRLEKVILPDALASDELASRIETDAFTGMKFVAPELFRTYGLW